MSTTTPEPDRFLREPEVQHITGLSRTTRWRLQRDGKFPYRRQISPLGVTAAQVLQESRMNIVDHSGLSELSVRAGVSSLLTVRLCATERIDNLEPINHSPRINVFRVKPGNPPLETRHDNKCVPIADGSPTHQIATTSDHP